MDNWCIDYPWRAVQTNLRQIDMADIDAGVFVDELKKFDATVVYLNAAGIIASYDTRLPFHFKSEYLTGDSLKDIIDLCHANGIKVVARTDFSKIRRPLYETHPQWAYRTKEGNIVDYNGDVHACINGQYQQRYAFEIIREMLTLLPFDGLFCNMGGFRETDYSYNFYGICHCDACKKRFREMYGMELPDKADDSDIRYRRYRVFKKRCVAENKRRLVELIGQVRPDTVFCGEEYERIESNTEYGRPLPHWQYNTSSTVRALRGAQGARVPTGCSVDFIGFFYRHVAVTPALQEYRLWQDVANIGGLDYYIMGRLDDHHDKSGYAAVKRVFSFAKAHEADLLGYRSCARVLLVRDSVDAINEGRGWVRVLTENHIPFDEELFQNLSGHIDKYDCVILADVRSLSDAQIALLDGFAKNGGVVLASGLTSTLDDNYDPRGNFGLECLGSERLNYVRGDMRSAMLLLSREDKQTFGRFTDNDLVFFGDTFAFYDVREGTRGYASLIPPHMYGPPERCYFTQVSDVPGTTAHSFGQGLGVAIPWLCGRLYHDEGYSNTADYMADVLFNICGLKSIAQSVSPMAEATLYQRPGAYIAQLVNGTGHFGTSYFKPEPLFDQTLRIPLERAPRAVRTLMEADNAAWSYEDGVLSLRIKKLCAYEGAVIEL